MDRIPITFEHEGKTYSGYFNKVAGAGNTKVWYLYDNKNHYLGRLRFTHNWVFDGNKMSGLAEFFGEHVTAWYK